MVGGSNAILHFTILNICFSFFLISPLPASIIATLFAMAYSFLLNKNFVFKSPAAIQKEVVSFVLVTISGVLFIHNLIYVIFIYLLNHSISVVNILEETISYRISEDSIIINIATVAGAIVAMIWNYNCYRIFVFKNPEVENEFKNPEN